MRTVDTPTESHPGLLGRVRRDVKLALRLARMTLGYATDGRRIREAYRDAQSSGAVYWVDEPGVAERDQ